MFKRLVLAILLFVSFNSFGQDINELRKKASNSSDSELIVFIQKAKDQGLSLADAEKQLILVGGKADEIKKLRNLWDKKLPKSSSEDKFNTDQIKSQFGETDGFIKDSLTIEDEEYVESTKEETEDALIELSFLGIENILAISGDGNPKEVFNDGKTINSNSLELVHQINDLKNGKYLTDISNSSSIKMCTGVGVYPENHFYSNNFEKEISLLKQKIEAGAEYAVTQMFFDNQKYFDFLEKCRKENITIPIIPEVPITPMSFTMLSLLPLSIIIIFLF